MILRPYQKECVDSISRTLLFSDRALVVAPTASGKTVIFSSFILRWLKPGRKFLIIVPRIELVNQTHKRFKEIFQNVSVYCAGFGKKSYEGDVVIGTIQSLAKLTVPKFDCVILDEAHNYASLEGRFSEFIKHQTKVKVIGFTATPWNKNANIFGDKLFFKQIDFGISISEMIKGGYIVPPVMKSPEHKIDTSKMRTRLGEYVQEDIDRETLDVKKLSNQIIDAMPRLEGRKKVLWVCASIKHAKLLKKYLPEPASIIHSKMPKDQQAIERAQFEDGDTRHMCCVLMATEGYDYPPIDAICFMRPTKSIVLFGQVIGRGLRLWPGKIDCLVLDYGDVVRNCGPLDKPRASRPKTPGAPKEKIIYEVWACPKCASYVEKESSVCLTCGYKKAPPDPIKNTRVSHDIGSLFTVSTSGTYKVTGLKMCRYTTRKGARAIRATYMNGLMPVAEEYFMESTWAFKWKAFHEITGRYFKDFNICYDDFHTIQGWDAPDEIITEIKNGFANVKKRIYSRKRNFIDARKI